MIVFFFIHVPRLYYAILAVSFFLLVDFWSVQLKSVFCLSCWWVDPEILASSKIMSRLNKAPKCFQTIEFKAINHKWRSTSLKLVTYATWTLYHTYKDLFWLTKCLLPQQSNPTSWAGCSNHFKLVFMYCYMRPIHHKRTNPFGRLIPTQIRF